MIPDAAVAHLVYLPDFAFEHRIIAAIEAATQDPDVPKRALALLAKSLRPRIAGPWQGSRASGIWRCERALVFEAFRPGEKLTATTILTFGIGHFVHAVIQAHFPGAPAEESWRTPHLTLHSDQRFIDDSRIVDYKTSGADGWLAARLSGRPKNEHAVQGTIYAVAAGCEWVTILYINKNGALTRAQRASREWKAFKAHHEALGVTPSELLAAYTFRADARIARGADSKARRIRDHVAAGTLPAYTPYPEMLRRGGECQYCPVQSACAEARTIELAGRHMAAAWCPEQPSHEPLPATGSPAEPSHEPSSAVNWQEWFSKVVGTTFVAGGVDFAALEVGDLQIGRAHV